MFDLTNPIFNDADKAREHLEKLRWPNGPVCPHCGSTNGDIAAVENTGKRTKPTPAGKKHRPARKGLYYCNGCHEQFSVQLGTVLEKSHIPINKWLAGFFMMCASKKGVSAHQLHRQLKVSYKSAWFMAHRIREAMRSGGLAPPMGGTGNRVEVDETYIGRRSDAPKGKAGAGARNKNIVLTLVERDGGARSFHIERADLATIIPIVRQNIDHEAKVATDDAAVYEYLDVGFAEHEVVQHSKGEYVRGEIHTNSVENYYSVFKRGKKGVALLGKTHAPLSGGVRL